MRVVRMGEGNEELERAPSKPAFNVKMKGREGYVGNAWVNQGQYGGYISVSVRQDIAKGSTLYLYPRKGTEKIEV